MGTGGGGLNILPHKSWNVYSKANQLRVKRDEAQARAEEERRQADAQQRDGDARREALLARRRAAEAGVKGPRESSPVEHVNLFRDEERKQLAAQASSREGGQKDPGGCRFGGDAHSRAFGSLACRGFSWIRCS